MSKSKHSYYINVEFSVNCGFWKRHVKQNRSLEKHFFSGYSTARSRFVTGASHPALSWLSVPSSFSIPDWSNQIRRHREIKSGLGWSAAWPSILLHTISCANLLLFTPTLFVPLSCSLSHFDTTFHYCFSLFILQHLFPRGNKAGNLIHHFLFLPRKLFGMEVEHCNFA